MDRTADQIGLLQAFSEGFLQMQHLARAMRRLLFLLPGAWSIPQWFLPFSHARSIVRSKERRSVDYR